MELDKIAVKVIHDLCFKKVDDGKDKRGWRRSKYHPIEMDASRAHAVFTGLKFRLDTWSSFQVSDTLTEQREQLEAFGAEIRRVKQQLQGTDR